MRKLNIEQLEASVAEGENKLQEDLAQHSPLIRENFNKIRELTKQMRKLGWCSVFLMKDDSPQNGFSNIEFGELTNQESCEKAANNISYIVIPMLLRTLQSCGYEVLLMRDTTTKRIITLNYIEPPKEKGD